MLEWLRKMSFRKADLLIGDSIHRLNVELEKGVSEEDALRDSIELGTTYCERALEYMGAVGPFISWLRCSEIQKTPEYESLFARLLDVYRSSSEFSEIVKAMAMQFLRGRRGAEEMFAGRALGIQKAVDLSVDYLLEEMAIFAYLVEPHGAEVFAYPGRDLEALTEIARGRFSGAPSQLRRRIMICLRVKGK
jgi:tRNA-dependent cyclodipeptide synthase